MPSPTEEKVQKQIVDYFCSFEELSLAVEASCERALRRGQSLVSLLRRYRLTSRASVWGTPLESVRDTLLVKLDGLINTESLAIREELDNLNEKQEKLNNKLVNLQSSCRQLEFNHQEASALIRGTSVQPSLAVLLEAAHDASSYVFQVCTQLDIALEELALLGPDTSDSILNYFSVPREWKERVPEIIRLTSLCSDNKL